MNLDYIEIAKSIGKDKINLSYLQRAASYEGVNKYYFDGCRKIEVWHNTERNLIKVKGSIPYFINGHNYYSSINDWKEGLDYISGCLDINIYSGLIDKVEHGTIQEIPFTPEAFLRNHIRIPNMDLRQYRKGNVLTGLEFNNPSLLVKLYDVNRNIKYKLDKAIQDELNRLYGWNRSKHYIKIENHYKKPEMYFGGNLTVSEILSSNFQIQAQIQLLETYKKIMKTGNSHLPEKKADINAGTIPLLILKELESVYPFNTLELIKAKLKGISEEVLSPADKKARMKTFRDNLKKISHEGKSEYDISELIEAKINEPKKTNTPFIWEEKGEDILSYQLA